MRSKDASLTLHTESETLAVRIFNKSGILVVLSPYCMETIMKFKYL